MLRATSSSGCGNMRIWSTPQGKHNFFFQSEESVLISSGWVLCWNVAELRFCAGAEDVFAPCGCVGFVFSCFAIKYGFRLCVRWPHQLQTAEKQRIISQTVHIAAVNHSRTHSHRRRIKHNHLQMFSLGALITFPSDFITQVQCKQS